MEYDVSGQAATKHVTYFNPTQHSGPTPSQRCLTPLRALPHAYITYTASAFRCRTSHIDQLRHRVRRYPSHALTSAAVPGPMPTATSTLDDSALMLSRAEPRPVRIGMSTASGERRERAMVPGCGHDWGTGAER